MRHRLIGTLLVLIVAVALAMPAQGARKAWTLRGSVGLDYWHVGWDRADLERTTAGLWGPRGTLGYGPVSLTVGYMTGSFSAKDYDGDWDREDWDVTASYAFPRYFSVFLGQKQVSYDLKAGAWRQEETYSSPYLGVSAFVPVQQYPLFLYASGSYLLSSSMEQKTAAGTIKEDSQGYNLEGGAGYVIPQAKLTILLGYRYNQLEPDKSGSVLFDNQFSGPILGLIYRAK